MVKSKLTKLLSILMALCMVLSLMSVCSVVFAVEPTASFRGYICHETTNFRASELIEVVTSGFDEENAVLQYKYTISNTQSNSNNRLYHYDTTDMTTNSKDVIRFNSGSATDKNYYIGHKYFAVATNYSNTDEWLSKNFDTLTVSVEVIDIGEESSTKDKSATCSQTGFSAADLGKDLKSCTPIVFTDESGVYNIKKILGICSIVHINCEYSKISDVSIDEEDLSVLELSNPGEKNVSDDKKVLTAKSCGKAKVLMTITKKNSCAHHSGATVNTGDIDGGFVIYVISRPEIKSCNSVVFKNVQPDLTYRMNGVEKTPEEGQTEIVFDGLTYGEEYTYTIFNSERNLEGRQGTISTDHVRTYKNHETDTATLITTCACPTCAEIDDSLTISAPTDLEYDGTEKTATLDTDTLGDYTNISEDDIVYYSLGEDDAESLLESAPINAGKYRAKISLGESPDTITAYVDFEITPIVLSISGTTAKDKQYDGTKVAEVDNKGTLSGLLTADEGTVDFEIDTIEFVDENSAQDVQVDVSYYLTGTGKGNYILPTDPAVTYADITPIQLTVENPKASLIRQIEILLKDNTEPNVKYAISLDGSVPSDEQFVSDPDFTGLKPNTTYYFFAKVEGDANHIGAISEPVPFTTPNSNGTDIDCDCDSDSDSNCDSSTDSHEDSLLDKLNFFKKFAEIFNKIGDFFKKLFNIES